MIAGGMRVLTTWAADHPRRTLALAVLLTLAFGTQFVRAKIDTAPENMLEPDQPDRVFYRQVKSDFGILDLVVVGIVDENGLWRPEALERLDLVTREIAQIRGVLPAEIVSLSTTDNVTTRGGALDVRPHRVIDTFVTAEPIIVIMVIDPLERRIHALACGLHCRGTCASNSRTHSPKPPSSRGSTATRTASARCSTPRATS